MRSDHTVNDSQTAARTQGFQQVKELLLPPLGFNNRKEFWHFHAMSSIRWSFGFVGWTSWPHSAFSAAERDQNTPCLLFCGCWCTVTLDLADFWLERRGRERLKARNYRDWAGWPWRLTIHPWVLEPGAWHMLQLCGTSTWFNDDSTVDGISIQNQAWVATRPRRRCQWFCHGGQFLAVLGPRGDDRVYTEWLMTASKTEPHSKLGTCTESMAGSQAGSLMLSDYNSRQFPINNGSGCPSLSLIAHWKTGFFRQLHCLSMHASGGGSRWWG
jgi:hypothetical protein